MEKYNKVKIQIKEIDQTLFMNRSDLFQKELIFKCPTCVIGIFYFGLFRAESSTKHGNFMSTFFDLLIYRVFSNAKRKIVKQKQKILKTNTKFKTKDLRNV